MLIEYLATSLGRGKTLGHIYIYFYENKTKMANNYSIKI